MLQRELMRSVRPSTFTFCEVIPFQVGETFLVALSLFLWGFLFKLVRCFKSFFGTFIWLNRSSVCEVNPFQFKAFYKVLWEHSLCA